MYSQPYTKRQKKFATNLTHCSFDTKNCNQNKINIINMHAILIANVIM